MSSTERNEHGIPRKPVADRYENLADPTDGFAKGQYTTQVHETTILNSDDEEQELNHRSPPEEQPANLDYDVEEEHVPSQAPVPSSYDRMIQSTTTSSRKTVGPWKASNIKLFFQVSRAPITMLASLIAGLLVSVAHHKINSSLDGQIVYTSGSLTQQYTSLYGIALAFLATTSLVTCVGTAFVQRLWLNFSTHHQPVRVKDFDTMTSALGNLFSLFSSFVWFKNPLLLLMVSVAWSIPLAAIFTPGTLSVTSRPFLTTSDEHVPQLSFNSTSYAIFSNYSGTTQPMWENTELAKVTFAAATSASILTMVPDHTNQTYALEFFGPALKCQNASQPQTLIASAQVGGLYGYTFMAYAGAAPWNGTNSTFKPDDYNWESVDLSDMTGDPAINETDGNSIWVMSQLGGMTGPSGQVNLTECHLQNASYKVNFTFVNTVQSTVVDEMVYMNPSYLTGVELGNEGIDGVSYWSRETDIVFSYKEILSAFGNILVGYQKEDPRTFVRPVRTHYNLLNIDFTKSEAIAEGLENLFQNITLSLFSTSLFLASVTDRIPVTVTNWSAVYVYESRNLLIAYGTAFLCSLICCSIGLHACLISKGSYQNVFSTHVRAAYQSNLSASMVIEEHDRPMDPTPIAFKRKVMIIGDRDEDLE